MRNAFWMPSLLAISLPLCGAERVFNFNEFSIDKIPPGFRSLVAGQGQPGDWKIILEDAPSAFQSLTPQAQSITKKPVLAQLSEDMHDEHFPILIFEGEIFGDFTFTTKFKTVRGVVEQMAGIVFRIQDEKNYYVIRASSLGNTFRFYKVVNGERGTVIGPDVKIEKNIWHELVVDCKGNQIRCLLDGKELIPALTDNSFSSGKIGFWTKSDSVSYFCDTKITYTPREIFVQKLLHELHKKNPNLLGLKIFTPGASAGKSGVIASIKPEEIGEPAEKVEQDVMSSGAVSFKRTKKSVMVTSPLRDRNGEPVGALQVIMKSFPGETEQNAIIRGLPFLKSVQALVLDAKDLTR